MKFKAKLHRVAIAVKDLDKAIAMYGKLIGTEFHKTGDAVANETGVYVAASWDAGIELVAPVPESNSEIRKNVDRFLETHGEGVMGIAVRTDDLNASIQIASEMGLEPAFPTFSFTQEQLDREFNGAFIKFEGSVLDSTAKLGHSLVYNYLEES